MKLSDPESTAISKALGYWVENWDWECPTLFGLESSEVEEVAKAWPAEVEGNTETASVAIIGALRELLWGASSLPRDQVEQLLGIGYTDAESLLKRLSANYNERQENA